MLFAGIGALFVYPPTEIDAVWTWETLAGYLYIIVVGTALAFVCYLKSLDYVPPAPSPPSSAPPSPSRP